MKILFSLLLTILGCSTIFSQGTVKYALQVADGSNKPLVGITVSAVETSTLKKTEEKTGQDGVVVFNESKSSCILARVEIMCTGSNHDWKRMTRKYK